MTPVTGPASQSGSFLVVTGEECDLLREVARHYLAETSWTAAHSEDARLALGDETTDLILARRAVCERVAL